ncbi:MAG TPA: SHOCT domain-containing protein [Micromonosporaceae bacterium]|jgi:putative membrane protein
MMHWYAPMYPAGAMMFGWLLLMVLATGLVAWAVVGRAKPSANEAARQILAERYARGEIDTEEYTKRLTSLR